MPSLIPPKHQLLSYETEVRLIKPPPRRPEKEGVCKLSKHCQRSWGSVLEGWAPTRRAPLREEGEVDECRFGLLEEARTGNSRFRYLLSDEEILRMELPSLFHS